MEFLAWVAGIVFIIWSIGFIARKTALLRCDKHGHIPVTFERRVYENTDSPWSAVMDNVTQNQSRCNRCHKELSEWEEVWRSGISSFTASGSIYDEINDKGFYISRSACRIEEKEVSQ